MHEASRSIWPLLPNILERKPPELAGSQPRPRLTEVMPAPAVFSSEILWFLLKLTATLALLVDLWCSIQGPRQRHDSPGFLLTNLSTLKCNRIKNERFIKIAVWKQYAAGRGIEREERWVRRSGGLTRAS